MKPSEFKFENGIYIDFYPNKYEIKIFRELVSLSLIYLFSHGDQKICLSAFRSWFIKTWFNSYHGDSLYPMYPVVACLVYVYNFIAFDMYQLLVWGWGGDIKWKWIDLSRKALLHKVLFQLF